ncbi:Uncharacterized membrane protein HdeD, DUF308 family [Halogranum gelatinilyticum]|uniref:Uncharacterized membrane protein HdeD, DUF308 family n=1 Tax=Halogranum gelatinilyticum TaxID=660521 RepID=A0A1G9ZL24_9EURY|nr:HdeD family acid-resistance protein [Halogranum gelatinilyticum]SDN22212.1 Uncharacterized membrane protein HdeD, DUF308 family [Halogranum gelatinilyticum]
MSSTSNPSAGAADEPLGSSLQSNWRPLLAAGVVVALLGLVATLAPFLTGLSIATLVGVLLIVGGVTQAIGAFRATGWRGFVWQIAVGAVTLLAGLAVFLNPVFGLLTLTLLVVGYLLASGVVEVAMGLRLRGERRSLWTVASGVIGIILALLLWAGFPSTALWAVGVMFGVNLLVTGLSMVGIALGARSLSEPVDTGVTPGVGGV